jgi:methionine synthase II (cobalamin-independent)
MKHTTDDSVKELVQSLKPMIKSMQKQQKLYLKQLEPIVREAIVSKNQEENYLNRLADSLSEMVLFSEVGHELYHELLNYIDTFNPELAQWYRDNDKEMNGL